MRIASLVFALIVAVPGVAIADGPAAGSTTAHAAPPASTSGFTSNAVPRVARVRRDRFANTLSLGLTMGAGSPLGWVGAFIEYRPIRWVAASAGGGFGGWFGPAFAGTVVVDPIGTRGWTLGAAVSLSHNFSWVQGQVVQGRSPLPAGTDWASVEVQTQIRPNRGMFLRFGIGRAFLLNTAAFRIVNEAELASIHLPTVPGTSPTDAIRAAARDEALGLWYVHLDIAINFRL